jgi:hypothetical protein
MSVAPEVIEEGEAIQTLNQLLERFGAVRLVTLLAELEDEHSEQLLLAGRRPEAARCKQESRVLERAASMLGR